jgi:hypothetical protein
LTAQNTINRIHPRRAPLVLQELFEKEKAMALFDKGLSHALKAAFPLPAEDDVAPAMAQMLNAIRARGTQGGVGQTVASPASGGDPP